MPGGCARHRILAGVRDRDHGVEQKSRAGTFPRGDGAAPSDASRVASNKFPEKFMDRGMAVFDSRERHRQREGI